MTSFHVIAGPDETPAHTIVRKIGFADLKDALAKGVDDFLAMPSHLVFLGLIYPIIGVFLARSALYLVFPLMAGFALVGPFAAIGLYEMSRRRELGLESSWTHAFDVRHSPSVPAILGMGLLLLIIFMCWRASAEALYVSLFGPAEPQSYAQFIKDVFTTSRGWTLILIGNGVGFLFAVLALSISAVSFPLMLDRDVGLAVAVSTSVRAVLENPLVMAVWGVIIAASLAIGFSLLLVGLAVVVPVLAHASWHLYRKVVEPLEPAAR